MKLQEALSFGWKGNAIAFLGSGFSKGAKNKRGEDFKTAEQLRLSLTATAGGPQDGDLGDAAEAFRRKLGDMALIQELTTEFSASTVAEHHKLITMVPWRRVYTTNYDDVFEVAAKETRTKILPITLKADPFAVRQDGLQYVHLNGAVADLGPEDLDTILKLTDTSYVSSSIAQSPWATTFRNDLRLADVVFYLGYSLFDLDIKRIVYESRDLHRKSFFVLGKNPTPLTQQRIQAYGELLEDNVADFAQNIAAFKRFTGITRPLTFESLVEIKGCSSSHTLRDQNVFDLFELGDYQRDLIQQSIAEDGDYYLDRDIPQKVLELLGSGAPAVVLSASLGNGKTLMLEGVAYRAIEKGYRVFAAVEPSAKAAIEFEHVAKLDAQTVLLVDDYPIWQRELRSFGLARKANVKLVLAARDTVHDVLFEKLESDLGLGSVPEIKLDKLSDADVEWVVSTLNKFGLWADLAGKSNIEKARFVKTVLQSEMHAVLLRLLKSTDIGNRLRALTHGPSGRCPFLNIVASVFVLASLKTGNPRIEMLADIWGSDVISSSAFRNDQSIRTLLDFERWTIRARSSIVAEYFLQEILGQDLVPILITIMRALSSGARGGLVAYRAAFEELIRFSTLQHVLPQSDRLEAAVRFYEGVKDLPQAERHPLFWLQFGIACLAEGDVIRSKRYFVTAYSLADQKGFDTFQIDNHYARLLLVESSQFPMSAAKAMENFRSARGVINRQMQRERLAYPFRVACGYQDFIDRQGSKLNANQLSEVLKAIDFVDERLAATDRPLRENRYVRDCARAMTYVRKRCEELIKRCGNHLP